MKKTEKELSKVLRCLPMELARGIRDLLSSKSDGEFLLTEIRLRRDGPASVIYGGENVFLFSGKHIVCSGGDILLCLRMLCEDSVHTYGETIKEGYFTLQSGYRVGICGKALSENESVKSVYDISALAIRVPHGIKGAGDAVLGILKSGDRLGSGLIYSPPGVGKTTIIRDIAVTLSTGESPMRVCIVDTRGEIFIKELFSGSTADVLEGYPRAKGIEIATRALFPEVLICDEIGTDKEAQAILSAQNSGVPLIATAHAADIGMLLRRPNIKTLHNAGIFDYYIGIKRAAGSGRFEYEVGKCADF